MTVEAHSLPIGVRSRSAGRTLTAGEVSLLRSLTTDWEPDGGDGSAGDVVPGALLATIVATLASNTAALHHELAARHGVRTVVAMGIEAVFSGEARAGDTVWAETWIESVRPSSSRPDCHVLTIGDEGVNQRAEVLVTLRRPLLVRIAA